MLRALKRQSSNDNKAVSMSLEEYIGPQQSPLSKHFFDSNPKSNHFGHSFIQELNVMIHNLEGGDSV